MKIIFSEESWKDYSFWLETNKSIAKKIKELIHAILKDSYNGIGKPEPLKHQLSGYWSRRINLKHRLGLCIEKRYSIDCFL